MHFKLYHSVDPSSLESKQKEEMVLLEGVEGIHGFGPASIDLIFCDNEHAKKAQELTGWFMPCGENALLVSVGLRADGYIDCLERTFSDWCVEH